MTTIKARLRAGSPAHGSQPYGFFKALGLTPVGTRHPGGSGSWHEGGPSGADAGASRPEGGPGPDREGRPGPQETGITVYLAVSRTDLAAAPARLSALDGATLAQAGLLHDIGPVDPFLKLKLRQGQGRSFFEATLHRLPGKDPLFPAREFKEFASGLVFDVLDDYLRASRHLLYLPIAGPWERLPELAEFSFLRQIKESSRLREVKLPFPAGPASGAGPASELRGIAVPGAAGGHILLELPPPTGVIEDHGVLLIEAGYSGASCLEDYVIYIQSDPSAADLPGGREHGMYVVSALLFGPLPAGGPLPPVWFKATIARVVDEGTGADTGFGMFEVLKRIRELVKTRRYRFVNLSMGPDLPVDRDLLHPWTVAIERMAIEFGVLFVIAAGNNGLPDRGRARPEKGRIEVPGDAANGCVVGATTSLGTHWKLASYSPWGPGRPGASVKPDLVYVGGGDGTPFLVVTPAGNHLKIAREEGTSFAGPALLRELLYVWSKR
jgi:hypothetical protein